MTSPSTNYLYDFLFAPVPSFRRFRDRRTLFWLLASLVLTISYPIVALQNMVGQDYWIHDDARQHIFWMAQFIDSELFQHDLIADYFRYIAPVGVKSLYYCLALLKIEPILISKIIPIFLTAATSFFAFVFSLQLLPIPFTGFIAAALLNQNLWSQDGLDSGTGRAFMIPIFLAFLWVLSKKSYWGTWLTIILLGLFYPTFVLMASGLLLCQLATIKAKRLKVNSDKRDRWLAVSGLIVAFLVLLPRLLITSEFEPVISLTQARQLPEFIAGGRASFFHDDNPWRFWFNASGTGIRLPSALIPELSYGAILLPFILRWRKKFALTNHVNKLFILNQLIIASFFLFFAAHLLAFKLYFPSRYTQHGLRFVIIFAASIAVTLLLEKIFSFWQHTSPPQFKTILTVTTLTLFLLIIGIYPFTNQWFPSLGYRLGDYPQLYKFLQATNKQTMVASLLPEASNIPSFAQRSVFVGEEYGIPYHLGYYTIFRQRVKDLITAHYSQDLDELKAFIQSSGVDFWLVSDSTFRPEYLQQNRWLQHFQPDTDNAIAILQTLETNSGKIALRQLQATCTVFTEQDLNLLDSNCLQRAEPD